MRRSRVLGACLAVAAVGLGAFLVLEDQGPSTPPFSATDAEVRAECLTATYVPEEAGFALAAGSPPPSWRAIEGAPRAMPAERAAVAVTLRPREPGAAVTLTAIHFDVTKLRLKPPGAVFYRPCRRQLVGAAVEADFDGTVRIASSSAQPQGTLGLGLRLPASRRPIRFPWTVSLKRPFRLYLVVDTQDTYSKWTARIPWTSGSSDGVIHVDNGGRSYLITDGAGTGWYKPGASGQWVDSGSSRWLGVR